MDPVRQPLFCNFFKYLCAGLAPARASPCPAELPSPCNLSLCCATRINTEFLT